jgi:hypothetical protein
MNPLHTLYCLLPALVAVAGLFRVTRVPYKYKHVALVLLALRS